MLLTKDSSHNYDIGNMIFIFFLMIIIIIIIIIIKYLYRIIFSMGRFKRK